MSAPARAWIVAASLLIPSMGLAQDATIEISEALLNQLVAPHRWSALADSGSDSPLCPLALPGIYEECHAAGSFACLPGKEGFPMLTCRRRGGGLALVPSGPPVPWSYCVSSGRFEIADGGLTFNASIKTQVDLVSQTVTKQAPARLVFLAEMPDRLQLVVDPMEVTLMAEAHGRAVPCPIMTVDVGKKYSFSIPLNAVSLTVPTPAGAAQTIGVTVDRLEPRYLTHRLELDVYLALE